MEIASVNLEKIDLDINSILTDIKSVYNTETETACGVRAPDPGVNAIDLANACKIFGFGGDKLMEGLNGN